MLIYYTKKYVYILYIYQIHYISFLDKNGLKIFFFRNTTSVSNPKPSTFRIWTSLDPLNISTNGFTLKRSLAEYLSGLPDNATCNTHPIRLQRPFDLGHELVRVQRVIKHVGELKVEGVIVERPQVVKVSFDHKRRTRHQVDPHWVRHADTSQGFDLLADTGPYRKRFGMVMEELSLL